LHMSILDMIAMFRSKEDNHSDLPHPLYGCQERVCMFRVLVHIISNILDLSQKRCLIFLKREVHENVCFLADKHKKADFGIND
jgi:hypothetical protein